MTDAETKHDGEGPNADRLLPVFLCEVHNVVPVFVDKADLTFRVHDGPIGETA